MNASWLAGGRIYTMRFDDQRNVCCSGSALTVFLDLLVSQDMAWRCDRLTEGSVCCSSDLVLSFCRACADVGVPVNMYQYIELWEQEVGHDVEICLVSLLVLGFSFPSSTLQSPSSVFGLLTCNEDMLCASCLNRSQRDRFEHPPIPLLAPPQAGG
jgi:hypothetical protein